MQAGPSRDILRFTTHRHFRQRILLSILSGKSIRVDGIRSDDVHVGLRDYEINLLRLAEKVTNGSSIEISVTGRSLGYYLELLIPLAPFCKKPFDINLYGVTGEEGRDMTIKKRGSAPLGGGQVIFKCPVVRHLKTLQFVEKGKVKKIRGVSSPGYGLTLVAQSTTSALHASECLSTPGAITTPEDIALQAARLLLQELSSGGCVDSKHQWLVALLMALGKEDVGKCLLGSLTPHTNVNKSMA
ncbi:hypothetical protein CI109_103579 [Kwoniella shandongensis]|uniref:RNA 3'-terminal phosphate cyclase-like protein n=1 Tax=Kwoniella shandongensis TaxID=1734106 RepID=A0AAJ8MXV9_9TREE